MAVTVDEYGFPSDWEAAATGGRSVLSGAGDWVSRAMGFYSVLEGKRLDARLAEAELQARLYGIPSKYQNPQAASQLQSAGGAFVPSNLLFLGGALLVGLLVFRALK